MTIAPNARGCLVASALVLGGCLGPDAGSPRGRVDDSVTDANYRYAAVVQAASAAPIPVEVRGSAAGLSESALADAVVDAMPNRSIGLATPFARASGPAAERVVWILGADAPGRLETLCGDATPVTTPSAPDGRLAVAVAWCQGTTTLSGLRASADAIPNPADPAFGALIGTLTTKLFPLAPPSERMREALTPLPNTVIAVE